MADRRAKLAAAFERLRIPLAALCICGGAAALLLPVWSGWWNHHVQAVKARQFASELRARPRAATTGSVGSRSSSTAASAGSRSATASSSAPDKAITTPSTTSVAASAPTASLTPHDVPTGDPLAKLKIPAIGVDSYVVDGLTFNPSVWEPLLEMGPSHLAGSALPGQPGNMVIFGHVNVWGSVFYNLHNLRPGDVVTVTAPWGQYDYRVTGSQIITPTETSVVSPHRGPATLELVTCTGLLDNHRLVVFASLISGQGATSSAGAGSSVATGAPVATTGPIGLVDRFVTLLGAGHSTQAWQLWSPAWQATHPESAWAANPPVPFAATFSAPTVTAYPDGHTLVQGKVTVPGPYGTQWSPAGFVVGTVGGSLRILAGGMTGPTPLVNMQSQVVRVSSVEQQGNVVCGPYTVRWTASSGYTPAQRTQVSITGPGGKALPPIPLAPLTFGTYPTWCGDMTGNGSTDLMITAVDNGAPGSLYLEQQASIYELKPTGYSLLGQVTAWADPSYPKPVAVNGMYPYEVLGSMVVDHIGPKNTPVLIHPVWANTGIDFEAESQAFPAYLRQELAADLAAITGAPTCTLSGSPPCQADNFVLAYYAAWDLREGPAVLAQLDALLPPADRGWMAAQASWVRSQIGTP